MPPIAYPQHNIGLKPTIIPFLLLIRLHICGIDIHAQLTKALIE
jgi:hypothetical protein